MEWNSQIYIKKILETNRMQLILLALQICISRQYRPHRTAPCWNSFLPNSWILHEIESVQLYNIQIIKTIRVYMYEYAYLLCGFQNFQHTQCNSRVDGLFVQPYCYSRSAHYFRIGHWCIAPSPNIGFVIQRLVTPTGYITAWWARIDPSAVGHWCFSLARRTC